MASSSFEKDMKELENIVAQMGKGSLPLEESIALFEKGVKLSKKCSAQLNSAEKKIQKIINSNSLDDPELEEFSPSSGHDD